MTIIKRQTIYGTIFSYGGVLVGVFTQAFLYAKYLDIEVVGLFAMLFNWNMILGFIMNLGFNNAGTKYFHKFRDTKKKHKGYLFNGLGFLVIGSVLVALILYFFKGKILNSSANDSELFREYYYLILPLSFVTALFYVFENYAKGLYDTIMSTFLQQFLQKLLVLVVAVLFIIGVLDLNQLMHFWVLALAIPAALLIWYSSRLEGFSLSPSSFLRKSSFKKEFVTFAGFSIVTGLGSVILSRLDSLLVYEYLGLKQIGIYNFCLLFGGVMSISYNVTMKASTAIVLDAFASSDFDKVKTIFKKSSITQVVFGTGLLLLVWINIDSFFSFIKPEYTAGKYVILIIGLAKLFDLSSGINSLIFSYSKYYKLDSLIIISFIGILLLMNHLLIPKYGLNGAAVAAFVATIYYNLTRNFFIWKYYKMHPYQWKSLLILLVGISLGVLAEFLPNFRENNLWTLLSVTYKTILIGGGFIMLILLFKISPDLNKLVEDLKYQLINKGS
ncbi:MAG: O-antigen/teichoic acid export membrane protein [Arcticibacterium sp.]|jgi:O-antigen/teichoic acid export membrane protein